MKPISIIGGGLAGLALGIELRRHDVPVTIVEAGHYPRHRVCGEFISGKGTETLAQLGVPQFPDPINVRPARAVAFFVGSRLSAQHALASPALCVSRHVLDSALADHFVHLGGELRVGERFRKTATEGVVQASGRRAQAIDGDWKWFGLKVHARNVSLCADLEMHLSAHSYVGLCRLPGDTVNVCGLFRRHADREPYGDSREQLRGAPGTKLFERLRNAEFDDDSFCAVAGLSLRPQEAVGHECRIGDALSMIPPITGNGMSIAFESAALATGPLATYAREEQTWDDALGQIATSFQNRFAARLRRAWCLHRLIFSRVGEPMLALLFRFPPVWRMSLAATR